MTRDRDLLDRIAQAREADSEAAFAKWRLIHKWVHAHPFHPDPALPRDAQWTALAQHLRTTIDEPDVIAFALEQAEINRRRADGQPDWRPRKDVPCHDYLLEYVANRKRKALAVHHFELAMARKDGE